jgi:hypothetical protein
MKNKVLLIFFCFLLSGCYIQSLNKFYTNDLKIELPQISGEWIPLNPEGKDVSDKSIPPWKFSNYEGNSEGTIDTFDVEFKGNNKYSELEVAYFKIGDNIFMDYTAGELSGHRLLHGEIGNFFWTTGVTITHSVCKIIFENDHLIIIPINYKWFEDRINENTMNLSFIRTDNYIFTATTEQWVSFLKTYGSDKDVFSEKNKFVFKKVYKKPVAGEAVDCKTPNK